MKTVSPTRQVRRGFTLIEMIGVLAIIAVLASLLIPRIMEVISQSRIASVTTGYNSIKAGAAMYLGKYGHFGDTNGQPIDVLLQTNLTQSWDREVLLKMGMLDSPFSSKLGTSGRIVLNACVGSGILPSGTNSAYNVNGADYILNTASGAKYVLEAILTDIPLEDARELNRALDGDGVLGESFEGTDLAGRVKYEFLSGAQVGEVRMYVTHL